MKINIHHYAAVLLLSTFSLLPSALLAQGSLTPPGAPAPTMKTLDQIEARTPISSAPFTISVPGSYYLTTNLTVSAGDAITIATNGVSLDLNGFTITSTAPSATGYGILINTGLRNLTIMNGFIQGGVTNNGGVYTGSGFGSGIYGNPQNTRVSSVSVSGCLNYGIDLGVGNSTVAESCTVSAIGFYGIVASGIKASVAMDCAFNAIFGNEVSDSRGQCTGSGSGINATTAQNCYGYSNSGVGLSALTAQNCYGRSFSSTGLNANTVQNCYGETSSGSYGLYAGLAAIDCYGLCLTSGTGVWAFLAINCYGETSSGTGLTATSAQNCHGQSSSGTGLVAYHIAIGCDGLSSTGKGLDAFIANSCYGSGTISNTISHPYNMP